MAREPKEPLTPREEDVLARLRRGLTNAQLASELGISDNTAKDHVSSILHKLSAKSRDEAAYWPQQAPWWARAPLIAPMALLLRRSVPTGAAAPINLVAAAVLLGVIAGLSILAFLLLRTDGGATPGFVSNDIRDLQPGMTLHTIGERYRRYGPAA
jgi:DNA-binding CsgD family transcriptional regulator